MVVRTEEAQNLFRIGDEIIYHNPEGKGRVPEGEPGIVIGFRTGDAYSVAVSFPNREGEYCDLERYDFDHGNWGLHKELAKRKSSLWCKPSSLMIESTERQIFSLDDGALEGLFSCV